MGYNSKCTTKGTECLSANDVAGQETACTWAPQMYGYPGNKCNKDLICDLDKNTPSAPTHCSSGYCKGLAEGAPCTLDWQCDVGMFCATGLSPVCTKQVAEGKACTGDKMCMNNLTWANAKCAKRLDIDEGDDCDVNAQCEYNTCAGKCFEVPSEHDFPHKCTSSKDCLSEKKDGNTWPIVAQCSCGKNPNGYGYCNLYSYDYYGKKYYEGLKDFYDNYANKCNILAGMSGTSDAGILQCVMTYGKTDDVEEYVYYKQQFFNYPEFVGAESCVVDTYDSHFEDLDDDLAESSDFAAALFLPLFFGLI